MGPKPGYKEWLHKLRAACTESGVLLIFDEVYTGFRIHPKGNFGEGMPGRRAEYGGVQFSRSLGGTEGKRVECRAIEGRRGEKKERRGESSSGAEATIARKDHRQRLLLHTYFRMLVRRRAGGVRRES